MGMSLAQAVSAFTHLHEVARDLVAVGKFLSARHMLPATSGNISARLDEATAAVTKSGVDKGELVESDIIVAEINGPPPEGASAETGLHLALYRDRPAIGAILHVHSNAATVAGRLYEDQGVINLTGWEMQKALAGQTSHESVVRIPVLPNNQDIEALALAAAARLAEEPNSVAYLIAGHGLYAWGGTIAEARRHVVALDHLLACELDFRRLRG
jgi:methylthioribulose-1-phosphate dehydratase